MCSTGGEEKGGGGEKKKKRGRGQDQTTTFSPRRVRAHSAAEGKEKQIMEKKEGKRKREEGGEQKIGKKLQGKTRTCSFLTLSYLRKRGRGEEK